MWNYIKDYIYKNHIRFSNRTIKKNSDDLEISKNMILRKMFCLSFDPSKRTIFSFDFFVSWKNKNILNTWVTGNTLYQYLII